MEESTQVSVEDTTYVSKDRNVRLRGGYSEYLETKLNHNSQDKILTPTTQTLFRSKIKLYIAFLS